MCIFGKPKTPKVVAPAPAPPPPEPGPILAISGPAKKAKSGAANARRFGTALLRNDLSIPTQSSGNGLNIPV